MHSNNTIVAHPAKQHSYKTAIALKKSNKLFCYSTTVYYTKNGLIKIITSLLPQRYRRKIYEKHDPMLDRCVKTFAFPFGFVYLICMNLDKGKFFVPEIQKLLGISFGKKLAKYINKVGAEIVISYDLFSTTLFRKLKEDHNEIINILDLTSIPALDINDILMRELQLMQEHRLFKNNIAIKLRDYSKSKSEFYTQEIYNADYILVASSHVRDLLIKRGIDKSKISIIPYGANFGTNEPRIRQTPNIVKFLFVGRVESAKGLFYLLEALSYIRKKRVDWEIELVGDILLDLNELKKEYPFCKIRGKVTHDMMQTIYSESDVFVLPSLWEGLSLSMLEAMGSGLPIVATNMTGAEDIVENYVSGIVVKPGCIVELENALLWFLDNKSAIPAMSKKACEASHKYSWDEYERKLNDFINSI